jgi:mRNA-degrading endonuclease YafQ of YafQ-DinJ toxin-antitoxin module
VKPIKRSKLFEKHFKKRITPHATLLKQFEHRLGLFINDERGYPLLDHALTGALKGRRAFSVNGVSALYTKN